MATTVSIDKAGRIVVPKKIREDLHLQAGDELELEVSEEGVHLRPRREKPRLLREQGLWVIDTGGPLLTAEVVNQMIRAGRQERMHRTVGALSPKSEDLPGTAGRGE